MKSFFQSSLDTIDPPEPFVRATEWKSLVRTDEPPCHLRGNRQSVLAACSLNSDWESTLRTEPSDFSVPIVLLNTDWKCDLNRIVAVNESVERWLDAEQQVSCEMVDDVFANGDWSETEAAEPELDLDLELGLLESVQELSRLLTKQTAKRTKRNASKT